MSESYEKLTVIELRHLAREKDVKLGAGISKQGIIDKLMQHDAALAAQADASAPAPAPAPAQRPVRSASIITDDEPEEDEDEIPVLTPNAALTGAARKPAAPAVRPAQPSSLSSISSKAPVFTTEGSRAWHNPQTYQVPGTYQPRTSSWNAPAPAQRSGYAPVSDGRYAAPVNRYQDARPSADNRFAPRPDTRAQRPQGSYQPAARFGPDQPEASMGGDYRSGDYGAPRNDYAMPGQDYVRRDQTVVRDPVNNPAIISEMLATGECGDGEGVLEMHPDGYGFLRMENLLPGKNDVYVSIAQIRRFNLRSGDYVAGKTRPQQGTNRYSALLYITEINGHPAEETPQRPSFETLTPIYPQKRMTLYNAKKPDLFLQALDLLSPVGFGQRALVYCPPKCGRSAMVAKLTRAISAKYPDATVMTLLIDERPEDVTEMEEAAAGLVLHSTFDASPESHVRLSELALARAERLVEQKKNVVVLIDSFSRLCRAYNALAPQSARLMQNGLFAGSLARAKKLFGAARNTREGGSLTIIATMQLDAPGTLDNAICEEFRDTANMELTLAALPGEKRMLPCVDFTRSANRRAEALLAPQVLALSQEMRGKICNASDPVRTAVSLLSGEDASDASAKEETENV